MNDQTVLGPTPMMKAILENTNTKVHEFTNSISETTDSLKMKMQNLPQSKCETHKKKNKKTHRKTIRTDLIHMGGIIHA